MSGGPADKWCSGGTKWWRVDLGAVKAVSSVTIRHASAGAETTAWNTLDYDIQVSNDAIAWTTVIQARGNTASVTSHAVSVSTRYLRLNVLMAEQNGNGAARIYEVEVYG